MLSIFLKKHKEIIRTFRNKYKLILSYIFIVIFLGLTESLGIALLFPISELIQNQEIVSKYSNILFIYTGYNISNDSLVLIIFASAFSLFFLSGSFQILSFNISARLTDGLYSLWQKIIFKRYLNARYSFFIHNMSGDLVQRLILHSEKAVQIIPHLCLIIKELFLVSFIIIILSTLSFKLTIFLLILGSIFTGISILFGKLNIVNASNKVAFYQKDAVSIASESINSIKLIKAYSLEESTSNKFSNAISKRASYLIYNQSFINAPGVMFRTLTLLIMLSALLFIAKSDYENINQLISFLILFAGASYKINGSIGALNNSFLSLANVIPSLKIISNELRDEKINKKYEKKILKKHTFNENIIFNNVKFSYEKSNSLTLEDVNFTIKKGALIGIVGESGSGKSTIIDLLLKFYDVDEGNIDIDNDNIKSIDKKCWRDSVGYVGQNTQILSGNIYSNISLKFFSEVSIDEKLSEAIRIADIENFIMSLPNKFNTVINENGDNISAGQKQRIAISRAIYRNPKVIIFDEATSNLNYSSEKKIFHKLIEFCKKNETTLIHVTHRTDILCDLDDVIYISEGKIVAQGKHEALLSSSANYKSFINLDSDL